MTGDVTEGTGRKRGAGLRGRRVGGKAVRVRVQVWGEGVEVCAGFGCGREGEGVDRGRRCEIRRGTLGVCRGRERG